MEFTASQIADLLDGKIEGDLQATVNDLSAIEAGKPNSLTFLANPAYTDYIYDTKATVAIVDNGFQAERALPKTLTLVRVPDARLAFSKLMKVYADMQQKPAGIHPTAYVHESAQVDSSAYVGPSAVIEENAVIEANVQVSAHVFVGANSKIGEKSVLHQGVHIGHHSIIGKECMFQPGCVIGGDGFGFAPNAKNQYQKVVHLGNVVIEDFVEIGANTTIDRATIGHTIIRQGVKLDNLIQIAHNVEIGENTVIAAQTGIAGSTKIGANCMIGGQVGIVGHIEIADEVKIAAQSGIGNSITEKGQIVQGSPAIAIGDFKRSYVHFRNLDQIVRTLKDLSDNPIKSEDHG